MAREGYFILDSDLHLMEPYATGPGRRWLTQPRRPRASVHRMRKLPSFGRSTTAATAAPATPALDTANTGPPALPTPALDRISADDAGRRPGCSIG
jgi:hypothetical protein